MSLEDLIEDAVSLHHNNLENGRDYIVIYNNGRGLIEADIYKYLFPLYSWNTSEKVAVQLQSIKSGFLFDMEICRMVKVFDYEKEIKRKKHIIKYVRCN